MADVTQTHQVFAETEHEFLLSGEDKVPLTSIDQKTTTTCLFFSANWCRPCRNFTPLLVDLYNSINTTAKMLEIIFISADRDESSFMEHYKSMPWLAAPFSSTLQRQLTLRYGIDRIPSLIPISSDGKTLGENTVQLIEDYGVDAFPFSAQRREELKSMDEARKNGGSLVDLLGSNARDYVISKDGSKVPISHHLGKTIGLYFGAHWCPPCLSFTRTLAEAYNELQSLSKGIFEVIFVSTDRDEKEFQLSLNDMPWSAIPYNDKTRLDLTRIFGIKGIPTLVLLGPDGRSLDTDGRALISSYGSKGYPFTVQRVAEVEVELRKDGDELPKDFMDSKHPHMLKLDMARFYVCDSCRSKGRFWVFSCDECDYDLHPTCLDKQS